MYLCISFGSWRNTHVFQTLPGGKHLALLPKDINEIDWAAHHVSVSLTHDELLERPEIDQDRLTETGYIDALCKEISNASK